MSRPDRQTDRQRTAIFRKFWTESGQRTGLRQKNPERQTPDSIFSRNPDRIRTADRIETDRIRTDRHRTENRDSRQTPDTIFRKIRTKNETRTGHRQYTCTAVYVWYTRVRLVRTSTDRLASLNRTVRRYFNL